MDGTKSQCWVILKKRTLLPENLRFDRFSNLSNCTQPKPTNNNTKTFQIVPTQGCKNEIINTYKFHNHTSTNDIINTYKFHNPKPTNSIISNLPARYDLNPSKRIGPYPRGLLWTNSARWGVRLIFRTIPQSCPPIFSSRLFLVRSRYSPTLYLKSNAHNFKIKGFWRTGVCGFVKAFLGCRVW